MLVALQALCGEHAFEVEVVDVDADPELERLYDELVPVLVADGRELCHYFLDEAKVRAFLTSAATG